jgi:hypothetical protein
MTRPGSGTGNAVDQQSIVMASVLTQLFRRPSGSGWLILSGGPTPEELIHRTLALVEHAGSIVAVVPRPVDSEAGESALENWTDVSGWEGRTVDCDSSDLVEDALSEAALVLLPDLAGAEAYTRALGSTDAGEYLLAALYAGVIICAEGAAAESLGEGFETSGGAELPALRWIPAALIQARFREDRPPPDSLRRKDRFRIGLPVGAAIALGPEGEREIWGAPKPTITFKEWWKK